MVVPVQNDADIVCMTPALGHESRFKEIDLQDNDVTAEGAKTLGHALTGDSCKEEGMAISELVIAQGMQQSPDSA